MIYVADAIMGTGKTSATITYFNEHKDQRFIFITPYLEEAARIKDGCPDLHFVEPSNKISEHKFSKHTHTASLIKLGRNIATTHQAFKGYDDSMLDDIRQMGYTLVIDENVDVLEKLDVHPGDLKMALDAGYVIEDGYEILRTDKPYSGECLSRMFSMLKTRRLLKLSRESGNDLRYWALPPDLITSFKDVFVLTYLFDGQSLHHFFKMNNISYQMIGIERTELGYRFCDYPGYTPEYVTHIKDMIHIVDGKRINEVGDQYYALSLHWFQRGGDGVTQLKNNVWNFFNHLSSGTPVSDKLCGTYNCAVTAVKGKGYTRRFLAFNTKATNNYKNCTSLAYLTNIFMDVEVKNFYQMNGIEIDEDQYALSIMVQWIWRSAIREGNEVYLYLPSKRMRDILTNWMDDISKGGEVNG